MPALWKHCRCAGTFDRLVLLDRDGVLNVDTGHVGSNDAWVWVEDAREAVAWLNRQGAAVAVATNQAGIAKGLYSEDDFAALMHWVADELAASGAHLDAVYYCPHHPNEGRPPYRISCGCRKPQPGMLSEAIASFRVRPQDCLMVGDKPSDAEAARRVGMPSFTYTGGSLLDCVRRAAGRWQR